MEEKEELTLENSEELTLTEDPQSEEQRPAEEQVTEDVQEDAKPAEPTLDVQEEVKALDVRGKLVVLQTDGAVSAHQISALRKEVTRRGALGVMVLPSDSQIEAKTPAELELLIESLQKTVKSLKK